jgi:hypothetical protein
MADDEVGAPAVAAAVAPAPIPPESLGRGALAFFVLMAAAGFGLTACTAFDVRVFGQETVVIAAIGLVVLCAVAAGASSVASDVTRRQPHLIPLPAWAHWWLGFAGGGLMVFTAWGSTWLVFDSGLDLVPRIAIFAGVLAAAFAGAVVTKAAADPTKLTDGGTRRAVWLVNAAVGVALGVLLAVVPVWLVSLVRTALSDVTLPDPPVVQGEIDTVVALGDSYSAGEGLEPYEEGTEDRDDGGDRCHRSDRAYSQVLRFESQPEMRFVACSGAITIDLFEAHSEPRSGGEDAVPIAAQVDPDLPPDDEVDLVIFTMGGNDVGFSSIVRRCFEVDDCTNQPFEIDGNPDRLPMDTWALAKAEELASDLQAKYETLEETFPAARIVVLGYPYLFPGGKAGVSFSDCDTILRRVSTKERVRLRELQDVFTAELYAAATEAGVEFVSPQAVWDGHEPCGDRGQYTNALNPIVFDGSFHPNTAGQRSYATLLACYLNTTSQPADGELVLLPWEVEVSDDAPAPGTLARPVPCPQAEPDE